jgi:hypothetical protein
MKKPEANYTNPIKNRNTYLQPVYA